MKRFVFLLLVFFAVSAPAQRHTNLNVERIRAATDFRTGQVNLPIGIGSTAIAAANKDRRAIFVQNLDALDVAWISTVTAAKGTGIKLLPGAGIWLDTRATIRGSADTNPSLLVAYMETFD